MGFWGGGGFYAEKCTPCGKDEKITILTKFLSSFSPTERLQPLANTEVMCLAKSQSKIC